MWVSRGARVHRVATSYEQASFLVVEAPKKLCPMGTNWKRYLSHSGVAGSFFPPCSTYPASLPDHYPTRKTQAYKRVKSRCFSVTSDLLLRLSDSHFVYLCKAAPQGQLRTGDEWAGGAYFLSTEWGQQQRFDPGSSVLFHVQQHNEWCGGAAYGWLPLPLKWNPYSAATHI